ncbi:MAG: hypothetical protein ABMA00_03460 [Gemmatimonas sp.]
MSRHAPEHHAQRPESALDALLRVENAVASRLEHARAATAIVLADAAADAAARSQKAGMALTLELAALDAEQAETLATIARDVAQAAADLVERYRSVSADATARLAAVVLADVTGLSMSDGVSRSPP